MKKSIRTKMLISIITLLTLLYVITGAATGIYVRSLLEKQADRDNRQMLIQAMQQMDIVLQMGDMTARQIMTDADIEKIIRLSRVQESQKYAVLSRANAVLTSFIALNPFVANIVIFTPDGLTLSNQGVLLSDHFRIREQYDWYSAFTNSSERMVLSDAHSTMSNRSAQSVVTMAYKYKLLSEQNKPDNCLMIDILTDTFHNLLQADGSYQGILVVNDAGQTIVSSDLLSTEELAGQVNQDGIYHLQDTIALYERMESAGWNLYYPIPKSEFSRPITTLLTAFALLYVLVLLVSIFLLSRRINRIVEPAHRITSTMQAAYNGNLDVHTDEHTGDEFEILSDCFNKLVDDLKAHIAQILKEENDKKEMQMDLMMSQIHPHFIYNTLNSAVYLIEEGKDTLAIDTICALINILQNTVRIGSKEIFSTIEEELKLAKSYAQIAAVRYPDMFHLSVECDHRLLQKRIPKVLIQPLVENAITHGILPSGRPGHIWIQVISDDPQSIDIHVADDGAGMDYDHLEEVWRGKRGDCSHGIGLLNIRSRIQCLYGVADSTFEISPRHVEGTDIHVRLPSSVPLSNQPE